MNATQTLIALLSSTKTKFESVKINISSSFLPRARCKSCGEGPSFYYFMRRIGTMKSVHQTLELSRIYKRLISRPISGWFMADEPRYFPSIGEFKAIKLFHSYAPTNYRTFAVPSESNLLEFLSCDCGQTVWAFSNAIAKHHPEILNRKGKYSYPKKFDF